MLLPLLDIVLGIDPVGDVVAIFGNVGEALDEVVDGFVVAMRSAGKVVELGRGLDGLGLRSSPDSVEMVAAILVFLLANYGEVVVVEILDVPNKLRNHWSFFYAKYA